METVIIAAMTDKGVIGRDNALPWRLPADLKRLKALTLHHPLIMGRRTFESLGKPLPQRPHIVVSKTRKDYPKEVFGVASIEAALALAATLDEKEAFIFGGARLYAAALCLALRMELTIIHHDFPGDIYFPPYDKDAWDVMSETTHEQPPLGQQPGFSYTFLTLQRK